MFLTMLEKKNVRDNLEVWGIPEGQKADGIILKVETGIQKSWMSHLSHVITGHGCGEWLQHLHTGELEHHLN